MAFPLVALAVPAIVAGGVSAYSYFSAREAEANAENTKNLAELEAAHAANPSRRIQSLAILAAAVGASFIGYKYAPKFGEMMTPEGVKAAAILAGAIGVSFVGYKFVSRK
ncbi:MAG: hypothetical protein IJW12_07340 [Opitutales bacterium]|nr:hypothetical protein [Opitutales bacterium]